MAQPKISIVTVSFNAKEVIEKTIISVINQTYNNLEYLIIDGGSKDGTQDIVHKYISNVDYYVSEKDGGIYFGMNKGIDAATGDYLLFLNSGDVFADDKVVEDVANFISAHEDCEVVYGNSEQIFEYGAYIVKPNAPYLNKKMAISHQATFVKTSLLRENRFDTNYRFAADFKQLSQLYISKRNFSYVDRLIARVEMDAGATFDNYISSLNEMYDIIASRGFDVEKERMSQIRRKKIVRTFKKICPGFIRRPILRFMAQYYKAL